MSVWTSKSIFCGFRNQLDWQTVWRHRTAMRRESESEDSEESESEEEEIHTVEKIKDRRITSTGKLEYLVSWEGWGPEDDTWEPDAHILDRQLVKQFERTRQATSASPIVDGRSDDDDGGEDQDEDASDTSDACELDTILASRTKKGGTIEYLIRWVGHGEEEDTWEPASSFPVHEWKEVARFWEQRGGQPPAGACAPEAVVAQRMVKGGSSEYLVRWKGREQETWQPPVKSLKRLIKEFERKRHCPQRHPVDERAAKAAAEAAAAKHTAARRAAEQAAEQAAVRRAAEKAAARLAAEAGRETARQVADKQAAEKVVAEQGAAKKAAAEKAAAEKAAAEKVAAKKVAAEKAAASSACPVVEISAAKGAGSGGGGAVGGLEADGGAGGAAARAPARSTAKVDLESFFSRQSTCKASPSAS